MRELSIPTLVLAGGLGTRLSGEVPDLPKAMAPVAGRPFAEWLVAALVERGARDIVFCTGHRHEAIEGHFGDGRAFGARIRYSRETAPLGTAGALRLAAGRNGSLSSAERFFVVNGDSLCAFDLERLARTHGERRARATLWTVPRPADDLLRYGTVATDEDGRVVGFAEKSAVPAKADAASARVNAGVGLFERSVLLAIPEGRPVSLERDVLPSLVGNGLWAVFGEGPLLDIGTPESFRSADRLLASIRRRRFVLLDRDGTLIVERNYLSDPADVVLTEGAGEALKRLASRGLGLVVVTNQSAVGRGFFDADRLDEIHATLAEKLAAEGVVLDGIYTCPHRPDEGCACRKPRTELVERAARELGFDPAEAFVVGDKASDVGLGKNAGAYTILVRTGYGRQVEATGEASPDFVADDLPAAADRVEAILDAGRRKNA